MNLIATQQQKIENFRTARIKEIENLREVCIKVRIIDKKIAKLEKSRVEMKRLEFLFKNIWKL